MRRPCLLLLTFAALITGGCAAGSTLYDFDGDGSLDEHDCGTADPEIYPGAEDTFGDGIDQDCDGSDGVDLDGDGFASLLSGGTDCVDTDPELHPADTDEDGYSTCDGDCDDSDPALNLLDGDVDQYSSCTGDCDDGNSQINPQQEEVCDLLDNDCDGVQDEDEVDVDLDGDPACNDCDDNNDLLDHLDLDDDSFSLCDGDCIDDPAQAGSELIYPAATDLVANGIDNNCDGIPGTDADGDLAASVSSGGADCDDAEATTHPAASDTVDDGIDSNCDGIDGVDADGDTVASLASGGTDCDDLVATTYPGAVDLVADSIDSNCDGTPGTDADGDLHASLPSGGNDCDDTAAAINPAATDSVGDAVDNNCDGSDGVDADGDQYASIASGGDDCDDDHTSSSAFVTFPGAPDVVADTIDSNCDGIPGTDADGDGYASEASGGDDCNDTSITTNPGATDEVDTAELDSNCDGLDGVDADGDLHATLASGGDDCNDDPADPFAPLSFPGAADSWGNAVDEDCDSCDPSLPPVTDANGNVLSRGDGIDADCDGFAYNGPGDEWDCDDSEATTYPGAPDTVGDNADNNCDGIPGTDADGDLHPSVASGGDDCDDTAPGTYPGAPDILDVAGLDTDCDLCAPSLAAVVDASGVTHIRGDGVDADCDGYAQNGPGFDQDCNDGDATIYPGSSEVWESPSALLDTNCDGDLYSLLANSDASFVGENASDSSGISVASAGDVDGDGLSDLLIGARGNADGGSNSGKTYLFLGSSIAAGGTFDLSAADASFVGENADDYSGTSVASAGDVDGDGLSDLLIGAFGNDDGNGGTIWSAGKSYLFLGSSISSGGTFNLSAADASFVGENASDQSGRSVASAGDVDGDGLSDLLIDAHGNDNGGNAAGKSYLFLGSSIASGGTFDLSAADAAFVGENASDQSGVSVASAGDVDGDGLSDLLIGAWQNDDGGDGAGKSYLVLSTFATPDYAGLWTVTPATSYTCGPGFVSAQLDHLVIDHVAPYATVAGMPELTMDSSSVQPGLLQGGFVTSATPDSFALTRTESLSSGACTATWSLTGSYTGPDTLSADFTATFTGSCGDCTNQSFPVTATR